MARGAEETGRGGRGGARVAVLGLALVFAGIATGVLVVTENPKLLRLAVVGALWAFVLATLAAPRRRLPQTAAEFTPQRELEMRRTYELELEREVAARREYEMQLEVYLRRELESGVREQVDSLRDEVQRLRGEVIDRLDGELRMERIETTRLIGGSLRALREEARRLGITFGDESRFPFDEGAYGVEGANRAELPGGNGVGPPHGAPPHGGPPHGGPGAEPQPAELARPPDPGRAPVDNRGGYPPDQPYRPFAADPAAAGPPGYGAGPPGGYPPAAPDDPYFAAAQGYPADEPAPGAPAPWLPEQQPAYPDYPDYAGYPAEAAYPSEASYSTGEYASPYDPGQPAGHRVAEYPPQAAEQWDDAGYGPPQQPYADYPPDYPQADQPPLSQPESPFRPVGQYPPPAEPVYPGAQPAAPPRPPDYPYPTGTTPAAGYDDGPELDDHGYRDEPDYPGPAPRNEDELSRILAGSPPPSPRSPRVDEEDTGSGRRRRYRAEDEPNEVMSRLLGRN